MPSGLGLSSTAEGWRIDVALVIDFYISIPFLELISFLLFSYFTSPLPVSDQNQQNQHSRPASPEEE